MDTSGVQGKAQMLRISVLILMGLVLCSCATLTPGSVDSPAFDREQRLKERAARMWDAMVKRDWETVYDMSDPFFRAKNRRDAYKVRNTPVYHFSPEVRAVDIQCNIATVSVRFEYELKGLTVMGKEISQSRKETVITERWIFVDDNWYRQYIDNITDSSFASY